MIILNLDVLSGMPKSPSSIHKYIDRYGVEQDKHDYYYYVLGARKTATRKEIQLNFIKESKKYHTDKFPKDSDEEQRLAGLIIREINNAKEMILDAERQMDQTKFYQPPMRSKTEEYDIEKNQTIENFRRLKERLEAATKNREVQEQQGKEEEDRLAREENKRRLVAEAAFKEGIDAGKSFRDILYVMTNNFDAAHSLPAKISTELYELGLRTLYDKASIHKNVADLQKLTELYKKCRNKGLIFSKYWPARIEYDIQWGHFIKALEDRVALLQSEFENESKKRAEEIQKFLDVSPSFGELLNFMDERFEEYSKNGMGQTLAPVFLKGVENLYSMDLSGVYSKKLLEKLKQFFANFKDSDDKALLDLVEFDWGQYCQKKLEDIDWRIGSIEKNPSLIKAGKIQDFLANSPSFMDLLNFMKQQFQEYSEIGMEKTLAAAFLDALETLHKMTINETNIPQLEKLKQFYEKIKASEDKELKRFIDNPLSEIPVWEKYWQTKIYDIGIRIESIGNDPRVKKAEQIQKFLHSNPSFVDLLNFMKKQIKDIPENGMGYSLARAFYNGITKLYTAAGLYGDINAIYVTDINQLEELKKFNETLLNCKDKVFINILGTDSAGISNWVGNINLFISIIGQAIELVKSKTELINENKKKAKEIQEFLATQPLFYDFFDFMDNISQKYFGKEMGDELAQAFFEGIKKLHPMVMYGVYSKNILEKLREFYRRIVDSRDKALSRLIEKEYAYGYGQHWNDIDTRIKSIEKDPTFGFKDFLSKKPLFMDLLDFMDQQFQEYSEIGMKKTLAAAFLDALEMLHKRAMNEMDSKQLEQLKQFYEKIKASEDKELKILIDLLLGEIQGWGKYWQTKIYDIAIRIEFIGNDPRVEKAEQIQKFLNSNPSFGDLLDFMKEKIKNIPENGMGYSLARAFFNGIKKLYAAAFNSTAPVTDINQLEELKKINETLLSYKDEAFINIWGIDSLGISKSTGAVNDFISRIDKTIESIKKSKSLKTKLLMLCSSLKELKSKLQEVNGKLKLLKSNLSKS